MTTTADKLREAKALIKTAYYEGFKDGGRHAAEGSTDGPDEYWDYSVAKHKAIWLTQHEEQSDG